ncbi:hypothetical protein ABZP36_012669 [Zizania latifolia]
MALNMKTLTQALAKASAVIEKTVTTTVQEDAFLDLVRVDATCLVRLRHLGMLHVVQALDETKAAMAMATEPVFASVANTLGCLDNVGKVPKELKGMCHV